MSSKSNGKLKKEVWGWCSLYTRIRDSIDYCKKIRIPLDSGIVQCCTCPEIKQWKYMQAGHFIGRGAGGGSGVYFDERNINTQCNCCNAFQQGNALAYRDFMLDKYGQEVIDELRWLDRNNSYKGKLIGLGLYYKQKYEELTRSVK